MFYLFSPCSAVYSKRHSRFPFPPSDLFFASLNVQGIEEKIRSRTFCVRYQFYLFSIPRARSQPPPRQSNSWGEDDKALVFFLISNKIRTKPSVMVFKHVMHKIIPTHHTDAVSSRSLTRFCLHRSTYWPKFAPKSERRSSGSQNGWFYVEIIDKRYFGRDESIGPCVRFVCAWVEGEETWRFHARLDAERRRSKETGNGNDEAVLEPRVPFPSHSFATSRKFSYFISHSKAT